MRLAATIFCFLFMSSTAWANCTGTDIFDALPSQEKAMLHARAAKVPFPEGLLWQVEKDGVTSYVIGTFHVNLPAHAAMVERLRDLPTPPEKLFLELTSEDEAGFLEHLSTHPEVYLIQEGGTLIDRMGPENWSKIKGQLADRGIPAFMAAQYQPWFLGITLMMPACAMETIKSGRKGLDRQIEDLAQELDWPRASLDTTLSLLDALAKGTVDEQAAQMREAMSLNMLEDDSNDMPALAAMYLSETVQLIWEFSQQRAFNLAADDAAAKSVADMLADVERDLIVARNAAWVETLAPALVATPSLVAVGALHLPGDQGVLAMLERKGYEVTRLPLLPTTR